MMSELTNPIKHLAFEYPMLGVAPGGLTVLFTSPAVGTVVHTGNSKHYMLGEALEDFAMDVFVPLPSHQTVALSN